MICLNFRLPRQPDDVNDGVKYNLLHHHHCLLDVKKKEKQGRCNEGFNAEPIAFGICILYFAFQI